MSSIYDWSLIASDNGNADSGINWTEGQPPSSVNNSARVMMQRVKELLRDLGGVSAAGGSANALTLTASSAFSSYEDGLRVSFRASANNTNTVTLSVNGIGAKPIVFFTSSGESPVAAGQLQSSGIYEVVYSEALKGGSGAWLLLNPTVTIPAGIVVSWAKNAAPSGWLECSGAAVSRTTYAALFSVIGTTWGEGNGTTTFNLPNLRGEFVRGWDNGRGVDSGRAFASAQADAFKSHTHKVDPPNTSTSSDTHSHTIPTTTENSGNGPRVERTGSEDPANTSTSSDTHSHTVNIPEFDSGSSGGTETRPRNVAMMFIIKT